MICRRGGVCGCAAAAVASSSHGGVDFAAVLKLVLAVNDDDVSCIDAAAQANTVAGGLSDANRTDFDGVIAAHGVDIRSLRSALDGWRGHDREIVLGVDEQVHVHKLIGKERIVAIVENGLQLVRAGGGIDLIVNGKKLAGGNFLCIIAVEGVDAKLNARAEFGADLGKLVLRQAEEDGDGLKLGDDQQAIRVVSVNDVPRVD